MKSKWKNQSPQRAKLQQTVVNVNFVLLLADYKENMMNDSFTDGPYKKAAKIDFVPLQKTYAVWIYGKKAQFIKMGALRNIKRFCFNFKDFKREYLAKSPLEKWFFVRSVNVFAFEVIGTQFMKDDYKIHFQTFIPLYLMVNYFSLLIYTLFYYRNEPFRALQSTPMCGLMVPVSFFYSFLNFIFF